ncbi:MAG: methylase involved in ubiquinone/menaquinone biosynthesis [Clostridia bacterium]|jgi:ubiquinone/menaquinone biosynthesis C-methylase UbiE|nr:methylase involved in ubiquinone/menaquinone biosynthesis [Clostridia bacterium]
MGEFSDKSRKSYDRKARGYNASFEAKLSDRVSKDILQIVTVKDGYKVLDVACGTGLILGKLSKLAKIHTYGADISEGMIGEARRALNGSEKSFIVCPSDQIGFEDNMFDSVINTLSFHHFENPVDVLHEMKRVLKDGGTLTIADLRMPSFLSGLVNRFIALSNSGDVRIYGEKELFDLMHQAGFRDIRIVKVEGFRFVIQGNK